MSRSATLLALARTKCITLDRKTFKRYLGHLEEKQIEKMNFFEACFENISRKILKTFYYDFEEVSFNFGDIITVQTLPITALYIVKEGLAGVYLKKASEIETIKNKKFEVNNRATVDLSIQI